ncbi:hypothetical protein BV98_002894 [Sphingobium herbicidovorans NBRC 16415]|uniref:Uncharacterized protein n=1 Tax=Sphingobium herbicidovorans (strain ATCC 700291 / DSM 11019 / CCUG 56400 / KCTC 2939 / LMG 18315 / NBRC 16415 / MH) TaxID=1219045 RepID=A0A086P7I4_SPHHM|nr:hypothetical protein [Sphingobium herbicidovorans]KFG89352.1 hypothetical protein BV98_002894 [Sphingobium herbicidovorans NBRC 16415]
MTIDHSAIFAAQSTYIGASVHAETGSIRSYYARHIIRDGGFTAIDEGDYESEAGSFILCPATGTTASDEREGGDALPFQFLAPIGPAGHRARQVQGLGPAGPARQFVRSLCSSLRTRCWHYAGAGFVSGRIA